VRQGKGRDFSTAKRIKKDRKKVRVMESPTDFKSLPFLCALGVFALNPLPAFHRSISNRPSPILLCGLGGEKI
jgi:hypothetical protein